MKASSWAMPLARKIVDGPIGTLMAILKRVKAIISIWVEFIWGVWVFASKMERVGKMNGLC